MDIPCVKIISGGLNRGTFEFGACKSLRLNVVFGDGSGESCANDPKMGACIMALVQTPVSMFKNSLAGIIVVVIILTIAMAIPNPADMNLKAILVAALAVAAVVEILRLSRGRLYFYAYGLRYKTLTRDEQCRYDDIDRIEYYLSRQKGFKWIYLISLKNGERFALVSYVLKEKYHFNELMARWVRNLTTGESPDEGIW